MSIPAVDSVSPNGKVIEPASALPLTVCLDDTDTPGDVVDALALTLFATGQQPWAHTAELERARPEATLRPTEGELVRAATTDSRHAHLVTGDGWTLHAVRWRSGAATVTVTAINDELASRVLAEATDGAAASQDSDGTVIIGFWQEGTGQGHRVGRAISTPTWKEIRRNYDSRVAIAIDRLTRLEPADVHARLLLLHGPPGTGKTTALRSLADAWRTWCQVDCVLDPERLFAEPRYLMSVAVGDDDEEPHRWRLLILEDCDELIRGEAKQTAGQALSRLLNITDGLIGQGRKVLVAITTNEDMARLHPAIVRPGRCLAHIEVGALSYPDALSWLGHSNGLGPEGATLAELYALRDGHSPIATASEPIPISAYL